MRQPGGTDGRGTVLPVGREGPGRPALCRRRRRRPSSPRPARHCRASATAALFITSLHARSACRRHSDGENKLTRGRGRHARLRGGRRQGRREPALAPPRAPPLPRDAGGGLTATPLEGWGRGGEVRECPRARGAGRGGVGPGVGRRDMTSRGAI